ncbi:SAM-dependent methyltransferase [Rhodoblastus sphagnicola]|uniref:SAM-dependent methyltransferase n=1 Tax=Rhodoblastus sphagnicola TaxID=333368 RepID=A0A2S6MVJ6_9HYPH|nr:class I SAM-dependent methyltransferase [Rhodoblastus sphagnicola]MBB4197515.1 ubiquinone/menaquinone biosynthesis C-methylase UbiE [Rhodoblastus sphagnicola]PPQ26390.1 SAM-dependent methyltransferase [Rhodoblastus sphagnicola]
MTDRARLVVEQFGPRAGAYVASAVHASGADLALVAERAAQIRPARALDLGCGGGHVAYALAPHVGNVVAVDLSAAMLAAAREEAARRGLANVETVEAAAERLPFEDQTFDFLVSRFSAHHWRDLGAGLREARRVLRAGAPAFFIDIVSPGVAALDTHLQAFELLRDPSHVRDYSQAEWFDALARAGFAPRACRTWRLRMAFTEWTGRMATPALFAQAILLLQEKADAATRAAFGVAQDGGFWLDAVLIES